MLKLRPYQQAAIDAIYAYFEEYKGNPLLVLPTAAGKALVIAAFTEGVLRQWPDQRIVIVTHSRELIAQNHGEMIGLWPKAPAGIYSAAAAAPSVCFRPRRWSRRRRALPKRSRR